MASQKSSSGQRGSEGRQGDAPGEALERQPIGQYLRRQRELRGITIAELADLTRIPLRSLERLESGQFDDYVDGFVRGFVRTVATALGLDPQDTLSRMLAEPPSEKPVSIHMSPALPRAVAGLAFVVALALGAGAIRWVWSSSGGTGPASSDSEIVLRRDPVRALAEAQAAVESGTPAVSAPPPALPAAAAPAAPPVEAVEESPPGGPER